jgi:hypothetical protein
MAINIDRVPAWLRIPCQIVLIPLAFVNFGMSILGSPIAGFVDYWSGEEATQRRKQRYAEIYGPEGMGELAFSRNCAWITVAVVLTGWVVTGIYWFFYKP